MEDQKTFKEVVDKSSKIRQDLNENWHSKMSVLASVFETITGTDRKTFLTIKDMEYYQGGYPSPESPPKIEALMDRFILVYKWYVFIGKESRISKYFESHGLEISVKGADIENIKVNIDSLKPKVKSKFLAMAGPESKLPTNKKAFVLLLLAKGCELQATICDMANQIKIDNFEVVKEKCDVSKPNFITSVQLSYEKLKNEARAEVEIKKKDHEADDLKEALVIIKP